MNIDTDYINIRDSRVYAISKHMIDEKGLRIIRNGLLLGELKKNRFEPSQALAMALKKEQYNNCIDLKLNDERVIRYLKGETIDVDDFPDSKGWALVCVDGYPLGWGKSNGSQLKISILQVGDGCKMQLRLDKYLCDMQEGTRSTVKDMIRKQRVSVNDIVVTRPELKVNTDKDIVCIDGRQIGYFHYEYYMLNKPQGVVSATTDKTDKTVIDIITDKKEKIFSSRKT